MGVGVKRDTTTCDTDKQTNALIDTCVVFRYGLQSLTYCLGMTHWILDFALFAFSHSSRETGLPGQYWENYAPVRHSFAWRNSCWYTAQTALV